MFDTDPESKTSFGGGVLLGMLLARRNDSVDSPAEGGASGSLRVVALALAAYVAIVSFFGVGLAWADGYRRAGYGIYRFMADGMSFIDLCGGNPLPFQIFVACMLIAVVAVFSVSGVFLWGYLMAYVGVGLLFAAGTDCLGIENHLLRFYLPGLLGVFQAFYVLRHRHIATPVMRLCWLVFSIGFGVCVLYAFAYATAGCVTRLIAWVCQ